MSESISKSKSSLDLLVDVSVLCRCAHAKKRKCGSSCFRTSTFGKNSINSMKDTFRDETDLVIQDLLNECRDETLNLLRPVMMIWRL